MAIVTSVARHINVILRSIASCRLTAPRVPHGVSKNANFCSKAWRDAVDNPSTRTTTLRSSRALLQVPRAIYCAESGAWGVLAASRCETGDIDFRP